MEENEEQRPIDVCNRHSKVVPLIFTFAFNGAECWCPHCGATYDMFGSGKRADATPELIAEKEEWKAKTEEFLDAKSAMVCSSLEWEGKQISPKDLPQEEKDRIAKVIKSWRYAADGEDSE